MKLPKLGFPYQEHDEMMQAMVDVLLLYKKLNKETSEKCNELVLDTMKRHYLITKIMEFELELINEIRTENHGRNSKN